MSERDGGTEALEKPAESDGADGAPDTGGDVERTPAAKSSGAAKAAADTSDADTGAGDDGDDDGGMPGEPAAKAKPAKKSSGTVLDAVDEDDDGEAADEDADAEEGEADEPAASWRDEVFADVEKRLLAKARTPEAKAEATKQVSRIKKQLGRYASVSDMATALINAQDKIRSGEYKRGLAEDATPEEVATWREENGIPAEPKSYDIPKVPGRQWTPADQPMLDAAKEVFHDANVPQAAVDKLMTWYGQTLSRAEEAAVEVLDEIDYADRDTLVSDLRGEMKGDFKPNLQLMDRLMKDPEFMPNGLGKRLLDARDENGHRLINDPDFSRFLIQMSRDLYGQTMVQHTGEVTQRNNRKAEIEQVMKTNMSDYWARGLDKELAQIMQAEEAANSRRGRGQMMYDEDDGAPMWR